MVNRLSWRWMFCAVPRVLARAALLIALCSCAADRAAASADGSSGPADAAWSTIGDAALADARDDRSSDALETGAADCGPHGALHGDHCDCDEGYRADGLRCVAVAECAQDDRNEPNDRLEQATMVTVGAPIRGRRCAGDVDLFRVRVEQGQRVVANLRFSQRDGDLDLWLYEPGRAPLVDRAIARSESADDDEHVAHRARQTGEFVLVVVGGAPSAQCAYALDVAIEP